MSLSVDLGYQNNSGKCEAPTNQNHPLVDYDKVEKHYQDFDFGGLTLKVYRSVVKNLQQADDGSIIAESFKFNAEMDGQTGVSLISFTAKDGVKKSLQIEGGRVICLMDDFNQISVLLAPGVADDVVFITKVDGISIEPAKLGEATLHLLPVKHRQAIGWGSTEVSQYLSFNK